MIEYKQGTKRATIEDIGMFRERHEVKLYVNDILTTTKEATRWNNAKLIVNQFFGNVITGKRIDEK